MRLSIKTKIIYGYLIVIFIAIIIGIFFIWQFFKISEPINKNIYDSLGLIKIEFDLENSASLIVYYDEVLTQSARNYVFTGEEKWKERYFIYTDRLEDLIKKSIEIGGSLEREHFEQINQVNISLIEMENQAIYLMDGGQPDKALDILESDEYQIKKNAYSDELKDYLEERGFIYSESLDSLSILFSDIVEKINQRIIRDVYIFVILVFLGIFIDVILIYLLVRSLNRPIADLIEVANEMSKGNLDRRAIIVSDDEIGDLAKTFNAMADEIKKNKLNIEKKVYDRTETLEKLNKFMVGRELKMIELKKEIKKLRKS